jgi:hypothetical protein
MKNQLGLMKAYLDLTTLKKNVPRSHEVKEKYVRKYNSIINLLARSSDYNLDSFRVSESEIYEKERDFTISSDEGDDCFTHLKSEIHQEESDDYTHQLSDLYCGRASLMKKLGPILNSFKVTSTDGIPHVDFKLPDK